MLPALATVADAAAFDLDVTDGALLRASVRVRAYTGQQISAGTSTVTLRGPVCRLPQRPVTAVTSVTDEDGVVLASTDYELAPGGTLSVDDTGLLTVTYSHGFAVIPDEVVEVVCTVAARLSVSNEALASGVQQEQSGSASQTFGWDAWKAQSSLTSEEKAVLDRLFPKMPGLVVMHL